MKKEIKQSYNKGYVIGLLIGGIGGMLFTTLIIQIALENLKKQLETLFIFASVLYIWLMIIYNPFLYKKYKKLETWMKL